MDSSGGSSISSLDASEATKLLKEMLKMGGLENPGLGKARSESSDTSTASLASHVKAALENSSGSHGIDKMGSDRDSRHENGNASLEEISLPGAEPMSGKQTVRLQGTDTSNSFVITGRHVEIIESESSGSSQASSGSNKVKINPVVKFEWEHRYYTGNMVAVHTDCVHVAYVLKGKSGGIVRVINRKTAQRTLLKGFSGRVQDIAFAHLSSLVLGCVDEAGDMFIYDIQESSDSNITTTLLLHVTRPQGSPPCAHHRLIWCPYIGDADDSSAANTTNTTDSLSMCDYNRMLVLTLDNMVEIWNIDMVVKEHGGGPLVSTDITTGLLRIEQDGHKAPITSAAFSPDGTAIATAGLDGQVKFFQVYFSDNTPPRCLHQWTPHNGRPLSSLFFLDDHKHPNPNATFWKFAVTGADSNREMKVWGCESWVCLQQINITSPPDDLPSNFHMEPCLKASLDLSANYLVLSDIRRKVLLVFELSQDEKSACMSAVSEFLLTQPCLSFSVLDAGRRRTHKAEDDEVDAIADMTTGEVNIDDEDEEVCRDVVGPDIEVALNMYSVHTKAFQHLQIRYKVDWTSSRPPPLCTSLVSHDSAGFIDPLSDMSVDTVGSELEGAMGAMGLNDANHHASVLPQGLEQPLVALPAPSAPPAPILMTPDAFSSPSPKKPESFIYHADALIQSSMSTLSSLTHVTTMDDDHAATNTTAGHDSTASSVTITPASSVDLTAGLPLGTPSSVPLPPPTPGEDASNGSSRRASEVEVTSPTSFRSEPPEFIKDTLPRLPSPPHSEGSFAATIPPISNDFFTSSPMSHANHRFKPAAVPSNGQDAVDKLFGSDVGSSAHHQRAKLQSNGSSSSTSLEVSEILDGMKKGDAEGLVGEEDEEDKMVLEPSSGMDGDVIARIPEKPHYDLKAWPKPPDVADVNREVERMTGDDPLQQGELENHLVVAVDTGPPVKQQQDDVHIEEEDDGSKPPELLSQHNDDRSKSHDQAVPRNEPPQLTTAESSLIPELQTCVRQMLELLQTQHHEITSLRRDLTEQQRLSTAVTGLQADVQSLETRLSTQVMAALREHAQLESQRLQKVLDTSDGQQRQQQDHLVSSVTASLDRSVSSRLNQLVKDEFSRTVVPNVTHVLDRVSEKLHTEMAQKLTATDSLMKENISKLVRSRQTMEVLAQTAGNAIQMPVQAACRDVLVPGFDRACQGVFHQVNQTFQHGTQEYMQSLERHLDHVRRQHAESRDPVVQQLQAMVAAFEGREEAYKPLCGQLQQVSETMRSSAQQIQASNSRLETSVQEAMSRMQDSLSGQLRTIIQTELTTALQDQQTSLGDHLVNAMRSGAVTPIVTAVTPDPQQLQGQVLSLLRQGQLNSAFQQALSASDLCLVMYVCETVNPSQVFNQTPCPLQQPVLLSLIQQLSADLTANMELKYKYLEEAIMNLDTSNPVTKEHMPAVLGQLCQSLTAYIHTNPTDQMTRNMRILQMAAQSLLK